MKYTTNDIIRYVSGNMNETEMHGIEKESLQDPLLALSIEGFQAAANANDLEKLNTEIEDFDGILKKHIQVINSPVKVVDEKTFAELKETISPSETVADLKDIKSDFVSVVSKVVNNELSDRQKSLYKIDGLDYIDELFKKRKVVDFNKKKMQNFEYGISPEALKNSQSNLQFVSIIISFFVVCLEFYQQSKKNKKALIDVSQVRSQFKNELIKTGLADSADEVSKKYISELINLIVKL